MATITLNDQRFELVDDETVLDCLLRHEQEVAYACRSGVCQSCLIKVESGEISDKAQKGLKTTLKASGYALACQWVPESDAAIRLPGNEENSVAMRVASKTMLNADVLCLQLSPDAASDLDCKPGQYLNLTNLDGICRSYSVANDVSRTGMVEFHIARTQLGLFTGWLFNDCAAGDKLQVRGPAGDCFYVADESADFPMLLVGTGTGLAPLYGIVNDALAQGHKGSITLIHGARSASRLYYVDELATLARRHTNFGYQALVQENAGLTDTIRQGDIVEAALSALDQPSLKTVRVYLCGAPDFVQQLRKTIFLKGVSSANIFCDAFVTRAIPPETL